MRGVITSISNIKHSLAAAIIATVAGTPLAYAADADLSKHSMMGKMKPAEWYPFVAGIVEGVAFHRYTAAGKDAGVMNCVYDWFYKTDGTLDAIYSAFGKFPDFPPAAVVDALAKRKCGE
ncbi:MAG: hypothetical protein AB7P20_19340 [Rhizobiaceae bacterium]